MDVTLIQWRKAARSGDNGGNCVEVAVISGLVAVRDSKDPDGPRIRLVRDDFRGFVAAVKSL
jgi:hypothetical protein